MFAFFDDSKFPDIYITFNRNIDDDSWNNFTETWENFDKRNENYTLYFDLSGLGMPHIIYAWKMTIFIENLKKRKKLHNNVYLKKSIIICNNYYQRKLLELVFYIQSPVAPVYIINDHNEIEELCNGLKISKHFYNSNITAFFPQLT